MTVEDAVRLLRTQEEYEPLIRDAYLDEDVSYAARRFRDSQEFSQTWQILKQFGNGGLILDLGAGRGIASFAMADHGGSVVAVEPDLSPDVGALAAIELLREEDATVVCAALPLLPFPAGSFSAVYVRQTLHHLDDLFAGLREIARVMRPGAVFVAAREHVVDDERQLRTFLENHPVHRLAGGEGAYTLATYVAAIRDAGLSIEAAFGPWDSVINAYPVASTTEELERYPTTLLAQRYGAIGAKLGRSRLVQKLVRRRLNRPIAGRMFTFVARKPGLPTK